MVIYGALLIPILTAIVLYIYFRHETTWWEFCIPTLASLLFIVMMKAGIEIAQVQSEEYWGSFVQRVEYYEPWNEYIHQTCTRSCGKNCTTTYDCSYVAYHSAHWDLITSIGEKIDITQQEYERIKRRFDNSQFVELNRHYYTQDGNEYYSRWTTGDSAKAIPVTTQHVYENRIKAADQSLFNFETVSDSDIVKYSLKSYPRLYGYTMSCVLGDSSSEAILADRKLQYINGLLGAKKQVKIFILIFKNQPVRAGIYQEWLWKGGNKNEFVICIGIDKQRNVQWCRPISWTRNEYLKAEIKNFVQSQKKLDLNSVNAFTKKKIESGFERRSFKEFDYLTVEPPTWAVMLTYFLTLLLNAGLSFWIIGNEYQD